VIYLKNETLKEKVLITGYHGSLAKIVSNILTSYNYEIAYLTTNKKKCANNIFYWNIENKYIEPGALINTKHIIHLAGFNIENLWTKKNKDIMFSSRVHTSKLLYSECCKLNVKIKTFISASAMGYYGFNQKGLKKEKEQAGTDWMANLCVAWENAADRFKAMGARVTKLRLALLISKNSGILARICLGFKFKLGIVFGDGSQHFPWIHIEDAAKFISQTMINKSIHGVFNVASPQHISYYHFIHTAKKIKYRNSILITISKSIINVFFPNKKFLLLNNIQLSIEKMKKVGFQWGHPTIEQALKKELQ